MEIIADGGCLPPPPPIPIRVFVDSLSFASPVRVDEPPPGAVTPPPPQGRAAERPYVCVP